MNVLVEYVIPIHGLKEDIYEYNFNVRPEFFDYFENPDYKSGNLKVKIILFRTTQVIQLDFNITGQIRVICDRCLENIDYPVSAKTVLFIRFGNNYEELDDNIIILPRAETQLNIAQFIYEYAILSLPYRKIHPEIESGESGCNPEMLKKIEELSKSQNQNIDPRWDNLKKIITKK